MNIERRREKEREKYFKLQQEKPKYGATNHGSGATSHVVASKPTMVADFGCGRNNFINNLKKLGIEGCGIDFVYDEADIIAPMHDVPLEDGSADFITAFDSLEHLLCEDVDLVFNEMRRVAVPGCGFCFSIAYRPSVITVRGENLHPTVRAKKWWMRKIRKFADVKGMKRRYIIGNFK